MAAIKPLIPPNDGLHSRVRVTSAIRDGEPCPTIYCNITIAPPSARILILDKGPLRQEQLRRICLGLMQELTIHCDTALGPPGGSHGS